MTKVLSKGLPEGDWRWQDEDVADCLQLEPAKVGLRAGKLR